MRMFGEGAVVLVFGASSGIGRATTLLCAREGAIVLASGRNMAALEALKLESDVPERIIPAPYDLDDADGLPAWICELRKGYGRLSGMAFCAGQTWNAPLSMYDSESAAKALNLCCVAPLMAGRGFCDRRNNTGAGAAIVFIAAAAAVDPNPGQGAYAAAKGGLVAGARCLAKEIAPRGLRVNCISPGLVETPMMDRTIGELGSAFLEREKALYPLGFGKPEDVANLTVFLLSPNAAWLTGQNIVISGGR